MEHLIPDWALDWAFRKIVIKSERVLFKVKRAEKFLKLGIVVAAIIPIMAIVIKISSKENPACF